MKTWSAICLASLLALAAWGCGNDMAGHGEDQSGADVFNDEIDSPSGLVRTVYPKSPPVGHLRVIDLDGQPETVKMLAASMQGIVNRAEPRIFTLHMEAGGPYVEDFWLDYIADNFGVTHENVASLDALWTIFGSEINGAVITDPDMIQTNNIALMIAAQQDLIVVDPSLIPWIEARSIPIVEDLRGRFDDNASMYEWAFENLWPGCNREIINYHHPAQAVSNDYAVCHKIFTCCLNPHVPAEREVYEHILANTPHNIPVIGWVIDELIGVVLLSENAKFLTASDGSPNLSVYSGLVLEQPPDPVPLPEISEPENTIYVSFAYTDADNETYLQRFMLGPWADPARGTVPIGWLFNAAVRDMAPQLVSYFHETLTDQDCFIGPVSGIGYMYPRLYPDLPEFLRLSADYWEWSGFPNVWIINDDLTLADEIVTAYSAALPISEQGIFIDYWPNGDRGWYWATDGTPVVRSQYVYLVGTDQIAGILEEAAITKEHLYPDQPTFCFIGVNGWAVSPTMIKGLVDNLDERYTVVRPDAMLAIMRQMAN